MAELSPAAQAVLDAPTRAAALRALADQVVHEETDLSPDENSDLVIWSAHRQRTRTRNKILAIAAEVEGGR